MFTFTEGVQDKQMGKIKFTYKFQFPARNFCGYFKYFHRQFHIPETSAKRSGLVRLFFQKTEKGHIVLNYFLFF